MTSSEPRLDSARERPLTSQQQAGYQSGKHDGDAIMVQVRVQLLVHDAEEAIKNGDLARAEELTQQALKLDANFPEARSKLGIAMSEDVVARFGASDTTSWCRMEV